MGPGAGSGGPRCSRGTLPTIATGASTTYTCSYVATAAGARANTATVTTAQATTLSAQLSGGGLTPTAYVLGLAHDLYPSAGQGFAEALAQERLVVGQHDPHGVASGRSTRPCAEFCQGVKRR